MSSSLLDLIIQLVIGSVLSVACNIVDIVGSNNLLNGLLKELQYPSVWLLTAAVPSIG